MAMQGPVARYAQESVEPSPADEAAEGAKLIPDCRMVVLEQSAHWPQWEEPDEFNRVHLDFLTS